MHIIPDAVTNTNVSIPSSASTTLTATGTDLNWYDDAAGTSLVGTGPSYLTPVITGLTNFWQKLLKHLMQEYFNQVLPIPFRN
ncbi:MAG: hypothetical protein IPO63_00045 [Bacteroidetes bacterium]|nr:hypothetical protein [Bacteroidota bacterium]